MPILSVIYYKWATLDSSRKRNEGHEFKKKEGNLLRRQASIIQTARELAATELL